MRRVILFAVLALVLPTAALANSISSTATTITLPFSCPSSGVHICHILSGHPNFMTIFQPFSLLLLGTTAGSSINISGILLSPNPCGPATATCKFTGGLLAVMQAGVTKDFGIVDGAFKLGPANRTATSFFAALANGGSISITDFSWNGSGHIHSSGSATIHEPTPPPPVIPEPGTLGLLGTGLLGLAGMSRRKRKLGT